MLGEGWQVITEAYDRYSADGIMQVLVIASVVMLLIKEKNSEIRHLVYYIIATVAILCMPLTAYILNKYFIQNVYFRTFWLVPSALIIACALIKGTEHARRGKGNSVLAVFVIIIVIGGKLVYTNENFVKAENRYKIPNEAIEISDIVTAEGDDVNIAVPEDMVSYIRQYNPKIELLYGRNLGKDKQKGRKYKMLLQLNEELTKPKWLCKHMKENQVDFIVINKQVPSDESLKLMQECGYKSYSETESYFILKLEK